MTEPIKIRGLKQNNLKNISIDIPKNKLWFLPVFRVRANQVLFLTPLRQKVNVK